MCSAEIGLAGNPYFVSVITTKMLIMTHHELKVCQPGIQNTTLGRVPNMNWEKTIYLAQAQAANPKQPQAQTQPRALNPEEPHPKLRMLVMHANYSCCCCVGRPEVSRVPAAPKRSKGGGEIHVWDPSTKQQLLGGPSILKPLEAIE